MKYNYFTMYLNDCETPGVTITANCLVVPARRNDDPNTKHPNEYVSFVANVTNASLSSENIFKFFF